ncbi:MAG: hypothetical protein DI551_09560 [Micavibrio aeruginosavorus]|uniref:Uncharacterized protein n=1 Tax=Micavibrio aeruginosavorus TaxID=349221 RepID=A0A2W5MU69_9BACT|nr:MAG: hypothetical protein DI551_09560 [Micavibrio aeruginosavorus]
MKSLLSLLTVLALCAVFSPPNAYADDELWQNADPRFRPLKSGSSSDDYNDPNAPCYFDCQVKKSRTDRVRQESYDDPNEIGNSFNNGRRAKTLSEIVGGQLAPSGSR